MAMEMTLILDTVDNVKKLNRIKQFRECIADIANYFGRRKLLTMIRDNSLTDSEKIQAFCECILAYYSIRIQMVRHGQKKWGFPKNAFSDRFLDWYMEIPGSPIEKYIRLIIAGVIGEPLLKAIMKDKIRMPSILDDIAELKLANSPKLREAMRDFIASYDSTTEMPTFSQDAALERIADSLAKPFIDKVNKTINDDMWNDALIGIWMATTKLLEQPAMENFYQAFAGNKLQNYIRKAIRNQLGQEIRKAVRDRAKRGAEGITELFEGDLEPIQDDEGNWISLIESIANVPQEDKELEAMQYLEALELSGRFSERELMILKMRSKGKTIKQIAKKLRIGRTTVHKDLKGIYAKIGDLQSNELGISLSDLFRPGSIKVHGEWQPTPDPTPYKAMINMIREELNKLTR